eukprot:CAMPEP_0116868862 /NCGR_PEP_ID=MMETSP0418-20121206/27438_1 /TAXON_ID=1158023 /ORGANISM="Astrosyne radiata, Strain 13vi08-1A" /LENGTH=187 /DNA_ID=CAMNT_0004504891 /DNA_START=43 /DNA_END=606 /DNA_ORIENTATION=+
MNRMMVADGEHPKRNIILSSRRRRNEEIASVISYEVVPATVSKPTPSIKTEESQKTLFPSQIYLRTRPSDDDLCRASDLTHSEDGRDSLVRLSTGRPKAEASLSTLLSATCVVDEGDEDLNRMSLSDHVRRPPKWAEGVCDFDDDDEEVFTDSCIDENARFRLERWSSQSNVENDPAATTTRPAAGN